MSSEGWRRFPRGRLVLLQVPSPGEAEPLYSVDIRRPCRAKGPVSSCFPLWIHMQHAFLRYTMQMWLIHSKLSRKRRVTYLSDPCTGFRLYTKAQDFVTPKSPSLWRPRYSSNWGLSNAASELAPCQWPPGSGLGGWSVQWKEVFPFIGSKFTSL